MYEGEEIERQIRALLTANVDSITFSNKLFHQGIGLFPRLGKTLRIAVPSCSWTCFGRHS